jgi:hypothetical protein
MGDLREVLTEINSLLKSHKENEWKTTFDFFLGKIDNEDVRTVKKDIRTIYGGMGSFNDLILYSGGALSYNDNVLLDKLRRELFDIINQP